MDEQEIQEWKDKIDNADQVELAVVYRFSPAGHPCFDRNSPLYDYFMKRFKELGGMTPAVSKYIGW
jgi:hypothetical protein